MNVALIEHKISILNSVFPGEFDSLILYSVWWYH